MTMAIKGAATTTNIRKVLDVDADGKTKAYASQIINGEPRILKKKGDRVAFVIAGRRFVASLSAWNARNMGYIEAIEV